MSLTSTTTTTASSSSSGGFPGSHVLAQARMWSHLLMMTMMWMATAMMISLFYLVRQMADWMLTPSAGQCPHPGDVVLVTGATSGIGLSAALHLRDKGFQVFAGVRKDQDFTKLKNMGLMPIKIDVSSSDQIQKAVKKVEGFLGQRGDVAFAGLINNAGVCIPAPLEDQPESDLRDMIDTNLLGAALVTRAFLPLMRRYSSRLIFTGSVSGYLPQPAVTIYTATKYAIRGFALSLAGELRPFGISVSVVEPSQTATPIFNKAQTALDRLECSPEYNGLVRLVDGYNKILVRMVAIKPEQSSDHALYAALTSKYPRLQYRTSWMGTLHHWVSMFPPELSVDKMVTLAYRALYGMTQGWSC